MALSPAVLANSPSTTATPASAPAQAPASAGTNNTMTMDANVAKTLVANAIRESGSNNSTTLLHMPAQNPGAKVPSTPPDAAPTTPTHPSAPSSAGVVGARKAANPLTSTMMLTPATTPKAPSSAGVSGTPAIRSDLGNKTLVQGPALARDQSGPSVEQLEKLPPKFGSTTLIQHGPTQGTAPSAPAPANVTLNASTSATTSVTGTPSSAGTIGAKPKDMSLRSTLVGGIDVMRQAKAEAVAAQAPATSPSATTAINATPIADEIEAEDGVDSTRPFTAKDLQQHIAKAPALGRVGPQPLDTNVTIGRTTARVEKPSDSPPLTASPSANAGDSSAKTRLQSSPVPHISVAPTVSATAQDAQPTHEREDFSSILEGPSASNNNNTTLANGTAPSEGYETSNITGVHPSTVSPEPREESAPQLLSKPVVPAIAQASVAPAEPATALSNTPKAKPQLSVVSSVPEAKPSTPPVHNVRAPVQKPSVPISTRPPPSTRSSDRPSMVARSTTDTAVLEPAHNALRILLAASGLALIGTAIPTALHTPMGAATAGIPGLTALLMGVLPMGYATRALLAFAPALPAMAVYAMGNGSHALAPALLLTGLCALWPGALLFRGYYPKANSAKFLLAFALLLGVAWSVLDGAGNAFRTPVGSNWLSSHTPVVALVPLLLWSFTLLAVRFSPVICGISALYAIVWAVLPFWSQQPLHGIALSALSAITGASIATLCATYTAPSSSERE